jgi:lipopolysaccharide transport system ATP-binding protein
MSDTIIKVENLSKKYFIGHQQEGRSNYTALRDVISNGAKSLIQKIKHPTKSTSNKYEEFWALDDVSFEIKRGEAVGIIGRNGAGKSTLLKILSRITEPTKGKVSIKGRVASLLEVGTGFHPELTGRENIYLNGAILGMSRAEIKKKFDEIVDFAEVEKFLDTPVKRYSSGMYVRLAFAVAAHLEPEILVVDEVLAVGDAAFQKKCLGKMDEVAKNQGKTVFFVSHNMAAVQSLCNTGCFLKSGKISHWGSVREAVDRYLETQISSTHTALQDRKDRRGNGKVIITSLSVTNNNKERSNSKSVCCGDRLVVKISYESSTTIINPRFLVGIYDFMNVPMFRLDSDVVGNFPDAIPSQKTVICETDPLNVTPGPCYLNVAVLIGGDLADHVVQALEINVESSDFYSTGRLFERRDSLFLLAQKWYLDET